MKQSAGSYLSGLNDPSAKERRNLPPDILSACVEFAAGEQDERTLGPQFDHMVGNGVAMEEVAIWEDINKNYRQLLQQVESLQDSLKKQGFANRASLQELEEARSGLSIAIESLADYRLSGQSFSSAQWDSLLGLMEDLSNVILDIGRELPEEGEQFPLLGSVGRSHELLSRCLGALLNHQTTVLMGGSTVRA